jgi:hypothetical protein
MTNLGESGELARLVNEAVHRGQPGPTNAGTANYYTSSGDSTQVINNGSIDVQKLENHYHSVEQDDERMQIIKWLVAGNETIRRVEDSENIQQQMKIMKKASQSQEAGSGEWLRRNDVFKQWLAGDIRTIWLHGGGKSSRAFLDQY